MKIQNICDKTQPFCFVEKEYFQEHENEGRNAYLLHLETLDLSLSSSRFPLGKKGFFGVFFFFLIHNLTHKLQTFLTFCVVNLF